jgi:hypothetical protein
MSIIHLLMAQLLFGCGMRLMKSINSREKDLGIE